MKEKRKIRDNETEGERDSKKDESETGEGTMKEKRKTRQMLRETAEKLRKTTRETVNEKRKTRKTMRYCWRNHVRENLYFIISFVCIYTHSCRVAERHTTTK